VGFQPVTKKRLKDGEQVGHLPAAKQAQICINYFHKAADVAAIIPESKTGSPLAQVREALLEGGYVLGERNWDIEFASIEGTPTEVYSLHI